MVPVAEAAGDAAVEFDEAVHSFSTAIVGSAGAEVGQELGLPAFQGAAEAGYLGDRAGREAVDDLGCQRPAGCCAGLVVDLPKLLGALPGDEDFEVRFVGVDRRGESGRLFGR